MSDKRQRANVYQFILDVDNLQPVDDMRRIISRFKQFNKMYNLKRKGESDPYIKVFLFLCSTTDDVRHKVYVEFDPELNGVNR